MSLLAKGFQVSSNESGQLISVLGESLSHGWLSLDSAMTSGVATRSRVVSVRLPLRSDAES